MSTESTAGSGSDDGNGGDGEGQSGIRLVHIVH